MSEGVTPGCVSGRSFARYAPRSKSLFWIHWSICFCSWGSAGSAIARPMWELSSSIVP